jgi:hypothetical protein
MAGCLWSRIARVVLVCIGNGIAAAAQSPQTASAAVVPAHRARVLGVFDETSGSAVEGVRVLDLATGASALTTVTGTVGLVYLQEGGSLVRLQKIGYEPQTMLVAIGPSDTSSITVIMRRVTELPTVVSKSAAPSQYLSPALRGFEERKRQRVSGVFIDDSILRRDEGRRLADLLRSRANVSIREGQAGATFLLQSPRCSAGGPPQVYLDGVPLGGPMSTSARRGNDKPNALPFDLSQFDLSTLTAVEYYADSDIMPIEFAHTSERCGALFLWTRER